MAAAENWQNTFSYKFHGTQFDGHQQYTINDHHSQDTVQQVATDQNTGEFLFRSYSHQVFNDNVSLVMLITVEQDGDVNINRHMTSPNDDVF